VGCPNNWIGDKVCDTVVPRNVRLSEAPSHGKPALLYDFRSPGARSYLAVADEFLARWQSDQRPTDYDLNQGLRS
jgi:chromosome partitioning protein